MIIRNNISLQELSWVKSDKMRLESDKAQRVKNLFFPENTDEFSTLIRNLYGKNERFDVLGYCSNTLLLPTYDIENVVSTRLLTQWLEDKSSIYCSAGVSVMQLSKKMIEEGIKGFDSFVNLPGTVAAAVYGNSGCYGNTMIEMVKNVTIIQPDGTLKVLSGNDLCATHRSTIFKRHECDGVIISVELKKESGDRLTIQRNAYSYEMDRRNHYPAAANNLGSTLNLYSRSFFGKIIYQIQRLYMYLTHKTSLRETIPFVLTMLCERRLIPYVWNWDRYMFLDEYSHLLFNNYIRVIGLLYKDWKFEIEIRK